MILYIPVEDTHRASSFVVGVERCTLSGCIKTHLLSATAVMLLLEATCCSLVAAVFSSGGDLFVASSGESVFVALSLSLSVGSEKNRVVALLDAMSGLIKFSSENSMQIWQFTLDPALNN